MTGGPAVLLVTHPGFGEGMLAAATSILGASPPVDHISNEGLSTEALGAAIDAWLRRHPGPVLILADLGFGSCCQAARLVSRGRPEVGIVAGVNLPLFLSALRSREQPDLETLMRHLEERGRGSVEMYLGGNLL
jgi:mannose/fructose-specific phosphotransferase system component IIA